MTANEALIERIEQAFASVRRPQDGRYTLATSGEAHDETSKYFGRDRRTLTPSFLEEHDAVLSWFTPEAWHYYLPAFLGAAASSPEEEPLYIYSIVFSLIPDGLPGFRRARWGRLSEAQLDAVREWLVWVSSAFGGSKRFAGKVKDAIAAVDARIW